MMPSVQVLLPAGALALYLVDSAMLLYGDEVVVTRGRKGWRVSGGWDFLVLGRRPHLPNPFAPHRLAIRQRWAVAELKPDGEVVDTFAALDRALRPVKVIVLALLALLIGVLPVVSMRYGAGAVLLAVFASAYVLVVAGLVLIYRRREALALSDRRFRSLAVDALACPPFAVNLVRKVSAGWTLPGGLLGYGRAHFGAAARQQTVAIVERRIAERLSHEDDGTGKHAELSEFTTGLRERMS